MVAQLKPKRVYSIDDYKALLKDGKLYELIEGELVEKVAGRRHGRLGTALGSYLFQHVSANNLGEVYDSSTAFILDSVNDTIRMPDVAFVQTARLVGLDDTSEIPIPPDLAVEIISPTDRWPKIDQKIRQYQRAGVPLIWLIDPEEKEVYVYHATELESQLLTVADEFDGENVIPGFNLKISDLLG